MKNKKQTGFTIIELLIVIVIIGILVAIVIVSYQGIQDRARDVKRTTDVVSIMKAMALWKASGDNQFQFSNTGAGGTGSGWFSSFGGAYSPTSIKQLLINGGSLAASVKDPDSTIDYMISFCTVASDNRRVVMARLKTSPSQTVLEQMAGHGCNHLALTDWPRDHGMNYARLSE